MNEAICFVVGLLVGCLVTLAVVMLVNIAQLYECERELERSHNCEFITVPKLQRGG